MPLGGSHGPRPGKVADREREKSRLPILGLSRKSSVTSTTSPSTKASSSTSWFSRGRRKQETAPLPVPAPVTLSTTGRKLRRPSDAVSSRSEPLSRTRQHESVRRAPSSTLDLGVRPSVTTAATLVADAEGRRVNTLRRKPSLINQRSQYARTEASLASEDPEHSNLKDYVSSPDVYTETTSDSVSGAALPAVSASSSYLPIRNAPLPNQATSSSHMANYNAYRAPKTPVPQFVPPLAPSFANSSGSSTRRSESPGSFSRTSTPTSVSSYSPGIPVTTKSPLRTRHISPTNSRPPVTRHWPGNSSKQDLGTSEGRGLSAVQELATSSSSSDTVRGTERPGKVSQDPIAPQNSTSQAYSPLIGSQDQSFAKGPAYSNISAPANSFGGRSNDSFSQVVSSASRIPTKTPPPRPSREGTPHLEDVVLPSPIIRSNLSRLETTGHKRRESLEKPLFFPGIIGETSPSDHPLQSIKSSRLPSPSLAAGQTSRTWPAETTHSRIASRAGSRDRSRGRGQEPSPTTPSVGKSPSRFGLFSRRTSPVRSAISEPVGKSGKKGPTAGTGHEGYGKYARRGRSGSAGTSASRQRSTSSNGTVSSVTRTPDSRDSSFTSREGAEIDDFLRDRLTPIVISGGRVSHDRNSGVNLYRTTSGASSASIVSSDAGSLRGPQRLESRTARSVEGSSTTINSTISSRRMSRTVPQGSENMDSVSNSDVDSSTRPTLAARRSMHRSRLLRDEDSVRAPAPINTRTVAPSPAMNTNDTTQSGAPRTGGSSRFANDISEGREGNWLKSKKAEKRSKSPSKWNFFQRANAAQKKPSSRRPSQDQERPEVLPVAITRLPQARSVPHYAMIDNNGQDVDDPEGLVPSLQDLHIQSASARALPVTRQEHKNSMLLPSPPTMTGEFTNIQGPPSPKILLRHAGPMPPRLAEASQPSEPRLQQIGRIPRVVSKRDRPHKPPPQSFSRPFVREAVAEPGHIARAPPQDQSYMIDRPILGIQTEVIPSDPWGDPYSGKPASAPARVPTQANGQGGDEFLIIPQRHTSQASGSSTSEALSFVLAATEGGRASQQLLEEDVWKEYDDLLDTVESPAPLPVDALEKMNNKNRMTPAPLQIRKGSSSSSYSNSAPDLPPMTLAPTSALPSPPSRMTLLSPNLASSPMSFSDFIAGYGDRNRASTVSKRQSSVSGSRYSQASVRSTLSETEQKRHTQIMAEKTRHSSSSQSNLRFSALMTSRWLSFGRVLFSPAHDEIQTTKQDRVLVLDGLGNDDWSFYCALTYPDATVYNLSSFKRMASASVRKRELGSVQSPPNHRQIFHAGMTAPFPFPKGYFSAAVFRFPAATTETAYYNAVSECKRVLRPGGYLEISILDLDMVNMGNRARRAVRGLKVKMQVAQANVSLKPVSDNIQKMLGRRGFENLNRCMVTVPVAGLVPDSHAGSLDERDLSLGDMVKDHSAQGDESITKMVSRVGRWWYTRCYEHAVLPDDNENSEQSIWADRQLLKECEKHETGIKLLICYAQKPERSKRRTISL